MNDRLLAIGAAGTAAATAMVGGIASGRTPDAARVALGATVVALGLAALTALAPDLGNAMSVLVIVASLWAMPWDTVSGLF